MTETERAGPVASIEAAADHYRAGDLGQAERLCREILAQEKSHFDALHLLGVLCTRSECHQEAVELLTQAARQQPDNALLLFNLGNAHQGLQKHGDAVEAYRHALAGAPGHPGALNNLGTSLRQLGRRQEAIGCFRELLSRHPDYAPALNNLAITLAQTDDSLEEAAALYQRALAVAPRDTQAARLVDVVNGLGKVLLDLGRPHEALAACRALRVRYPALASIDWNEGLALLLLGDYAAGWPMYEFRWHIPEHDRRHKDARVLDPGAVAGQRVLVTGEQGRGDVIQFARYAALLAANGAIVTLSVYADLVDLMRTVPGVAAVIGPDDPEPPYDQRTSLLSLPLAFGTELATIPAPVPYLQPPPGREAVWRDRLAVFPRPRIGIAWWGSQHVPTRSMPLAQLAPLLLRGNATFHSLQKELEPADRAWLDRHGGVVDHNTVFSDTAALIASMDLVITIDTAMAHMAGALARPVWIMLPFNADWRWLLERDDSPWYPTARLFRQTQRGDWATVVDRVVAALEQFLAGG